MDKIIQKETERALSPKELRHFEVGWRRKSSRWGGTEVGEPGEWGVPKARQQCLNEEKALPKQLVDEDTGISSTEVMGDLGKPSEQSVGAEVVVW